MTGHSWLLGVDAGGTATQGLLFCPSTGDARTAVTAPANWTVHGGATCLVRVQELVEILARGVPIGAACLACAGYYPPQHAAEAALLLPRLLPGLRLRVVPDYEAAREGGLGGGHGVAVIAGTGSIAVARGPVRTARAGGWGPLFGDEGSGYALGRAALRAVAGALDGTRPPTALGARLRAAHPTLGTDDTAWLRGLLREKWGRAEVAALAPVVIDAAVAGDGVAQALVRAAARDLALLAQAASAAAGLGGQCGDGGVAVVLQGGLAGAAPVRAAFRAALRRRCGTLHYREAQLGPLEGAVLLAAGEVGGALHHAAVVEGLLARGGKPQP